MRSRLFVGSIESLLQGDDSLLTTSDWAMIDSFGSERRRTEQFAWRLLLRRSLRKRGYAESILEADVAYSAVGAPYLVGCEGVFIGVSHSRTHVAVVVDKSPCSVDIESCARNFLNISSRYFSSLEECLFSDLDVDREGFTLPLVWAAKEALYKISGGEGLDLIDDLEVCSVDLEGCSLRGRVLDCSYLLSYIFVDGNVVVTAQG